MAVGFGTTWTKSVRTGVEDPYTFSFTPSSTPAGIVLMIAHGTESTDLIVGVTYGGVSMTRVRSDADTAGEPGRSYIYFLGSGVPTGAQTVSVDLTSATGTDVAFEIGSLTSSGRDTFIAGHNGTNGDLTNPSVTVANTNADGQTMAGVLVQYTGLNTPVTTVGTGCTHIDSSDFGLFGCMFARQTTPGTAAFVAGYTSAVDDVALSAASFAELPPYEFQTESFDGGTVDASVTTTSGLLDGGAVSGAATVVYKAANVFDPNNTNAGARSAKFTTAAGEVAYRDLFVAAAGKNTPVIDFQFYIWMGTVTTPASFQPLVSAYDQAGTLVAQFGINTSGNYAIRDNVTQVATPISIPTAQWVRISWSLRPYTGTQVFRSYTGSDLYRGGAGYTTSSNGALTATQGIQMFRFGVVGSGEQALWIDHIQTSKTELFIDGPPKVTPSAESSITATALAGKLTYIRATSDDGYTNSGSSSLVTSSMLAGVDVNGAYKGFARLKYLLIDKLTTVEPTYLVLNTTALTGTPSLRVYADAADNSAAISSYADLAGRTLTTAYTAWSPTVASAQVVLDVTDVVQEIVDRPGWVSNNNIQFIIQATDATGGSTKQVTIIDYTASSTLSAKLIYNSIGSLISGTASLSADGSLTAVGSIGHKASASFSSNSNMSAIEGKVTSISVTTDDGYGWSIANAYYTGSIYAGTKYNPPGGPETTFLRLNNLQIANSATVQPTFLVFNTTTCNNPSLRIHADAADNSAAISSYADLSGRTLTTAYTAWSPTTEYERVILDVTSVVQEIVNRPGWVSGNSIQFLTYSLDSPLYTIEVNIVDYNSSASLAAKLFYNSLAGAGVQSGVASFSSDGAITATGTTKKVASATFTAESSLTATGTTKKVASAAFTAESSLTATGTTKKVASATFTAESSLTATGTTKKVASAAFTAESSLTATGTVSGTPAFVRQATASENTGATSLTVSISSTNGNCLVATISVRSDTSTSVSSVTDTAGNVWERQVSQNPGTGSASRTETWATLNAAAVTSVTINLSGSVKSAANVQEYSSVAEIVAGDEWAGQSGASQTNLQTPSITPTVDKALLIAAVSSTTSGGTRTFQSAGSGWTELTAFASSGGSDVFGSAAYKVLSTPAASSALWTSTAVNYSGTTLALLPVREGIKKYRWDKTQSSTTYGVDYYGDTDLGVGDATATTAVIVMHGASRNAWDYAERIMRLSRLNSHKSDTVVVAPWFQDDTTAGSTDLWWSGGWDDGDLSQGDDSGELNYPVAWRYSSYAVVDDMLALLDNTSLYPNLNRVVVTGFSAGGQFTSRFAQGSQYVPTNYEIGYQVCSPSSYMYLYPWRYDSTPTWRVLTGGEQTATPGWDTYKYGQQSQNGYMSATSAATQKSTFQSRKVNFLVGSADTAADADLDVSAAANWQGTQRVDRSLKFWNHLAETQVYGSTPGTFTRSVVSGPAHDGRAVLTSAESAAFVYNAWITTQSASASFSSDGAMTATGTVKKVASSTLISESSFTAAGVVIKTAASTLTSESNFVATGVVKKVATSTLTSESSFTATGEYRKAASSTLTSESNLVAAGVVKKTAASTLTSESDLVVNGKLYKQGIHLSAGDTTFIATATVTKVASATFSSDSSFIVTANRITQGVFGRVVVGNYEVDPTEVMRNGDLMRQIYPYYTGSVSWDQTEGYSGSASLKVTTVGAVNPDGQIHFAPRDTLIAANEVIRISAKIKAPNGQGYQFGWRTNTNNDTYSGEGTAIYTGDGTWQYREVYISRAFAWRPGAQLYVSQASAGVVLKWDELYIDQHYSSGTMTATATVKKVATSTLTSESSFTATGEYRKAASSTLTSESNLVAVGVVKKTAASTLTSESDLVVNGKLYKQGIHLSAGDTTFIATATVTKVASATFTAESSLTATGMTNKMASAAFTADGAIVSVGTTTKQAGVAFSSDGMLSGSGTVRKLATATLNADGSLTVDGKVVKVGIHLSAGDSTFTATALVTRMALASLSANSDLSATAAGSAPNLGYFGIPIT